jgi:hypothetical protein
VKQFTYWEFSSDEIKSDIAELERELQALQGGTPVRQIRVYTSKGL